MDFAHLKTLSRDELKEHLSTLSLNRLLDLALESANDLLGIVEKIPEMVYDGMEKRLPQDEASREVAEGLMARLTKA